MYVFLQERYFLPLGLRGQVLYSKLFTHVPNPVIIPFPVFYKKEQLTEVILRLLGHGQTPCYISTGACLRVRIKISTSTAPARLWR